MSNSVSQQILLPLYAKLLSSMYVHPPAEQEAKRIATQVCINQGKYNVITLATGVPWQWIGAIHYMECGGSFEKHLANGDPISAPTIQEPAGIPAGTWEECAIAALKRKGYDVSEKIYWADVTKWLWRAEEYNGWGYAMHHPEVLSPYLWSGTNHYKAGKYAADGKWDPNLVSQQIGVVPILEALCIKLTSPATINITQVPSIEANKMSKTDTPIGKVAFGKDTPFKIGKELKPLKDLPPSEFLEMAAGSEASILKVLSENDRNHYKVELLIEGKPVSGWIYINDASLVLDGRSGEAAEENYKPLQAEVKRVIDGNDKKAVQGELIRIGLLDPPVDGKWGAQSKSAKRAFLRTCGEASDWTEESLARLAAHPGIADLDYRPADDSDVENSLLTKAVKRMVEMGFHLGVSMGSDALAYNVFYLAGINPDGSLNDDKVNRFNDLRCLVSINSTGLVTKHGCWIATVDAGDYWRGSRRMNQAGALQVNKNVQFLNLSNVGTHGAKQYPALVQCGTLTATRDRTGDGRTADDTADSGNHFGSNDHHAYNAPINDVGQYSAGCCVGRTVAGHEQFMQFLQTDRRYRCSNGYAWHRTILDGRKI